MGSGCGSVGRAVASNSRGPQFEFRHRQKFILNMLLSVVLKRRKNKEKEAGNGPEKVSFQCRTSNSFFLCYCNYVRAEDSFVHLNVINRQRQRQQNRKANYMPGPTTRTP